MRELEDWKECKNMNKKQSFSQKCYSLLKQVPRGRITTYKELAQALNTKAYRAVGNAMKKNPFPPEIRCYRVIKSNGEIGSYSGGIKKKTQLLKSEGVEIKDDKIDLEKYFYKFSK